jgi:FKBP-type peptidyl-prolyl cis-trans isomerase
MKKSSLLVISLFAAGTALAVSARAQQTPASSSPQAPAAGTTQAPSTPKKATPPTRGQNAAKKTPAPLTLKTEKDKVSYAIGVSEGKRLQQGIKQGDVDVDSAILLRAIKDMLTGGKQVMTDQEIQTTLTTLQAEVHKKQEIKQQLAAETAKKEGDVFLADNKTKEGVITTASGLQYKVLEEGTGPKPNPGDMVTVNYRGTLLNGSEFDNSYKRGQPASFAVGQVIRGWTEALQLMPVGSKWQLFIPSDLAYGPRGAGPGIGPNSTLIFEVELLSIQPKVAPVTVPPAATTPATPPATKP